MSSPNPPRPARLLRSSSMLRLRQYCAERVFPSAQLSRSALTRGAGEALRTLRKAALHLAVIAVCAVLAAQTIACVLLIVLAKPPPPGLLFIATCAACAVSILASALFSVQQPRRATRALPSVAVLLARKRQ